MLEVKTCLNAQAMERPPAAMPLPPDDPVLREAAERVRLVLQGGAALPRIPEEAITAARERVSEAFLTSLSIARVNIRRFHEYQRRQGFVHDDGQGVRITREVRPLRRVGILCGRSFADLLMHAVPAQVAGVGEIALAVAPAPDGGAPDPRVLAAARSLGLDEIYLGTGAEAVAALAFGAGGARRADKIVGPGGKHGQAAKRLLSGVVGVDGDTGRGELVVVADGSANARLIACDLLAQAEHGAGGSIVLLTPDRLLAEAVRIEIGRLAETLPNREELLATLDECGEIRLFPDVGHALDAANALAPARLSLQTADNARLLPDVETAAAVFLGPVAGGMADDTLSGLNSFLPLGGTARFRGGIGVDDFVRECAVVECAPGRLALTGRHLARLAEEEGFPAHGAAVGERLETPRRRTE